jgi:membrane fusion protein (multidrug efflux system)
VGDGSQSPDTGIRPKQSFMQKYRVPMIIGGPVILLAAVGFFVLTGGRSESTDNAYIQVAKAPVSSTVGGRVIAVMVQENQKVEKGQALFRLDSADYQIEASQAQAQLAQAELQVRALKASYLQTLSKVTNARQSFDYATREANRQRELLKAGVVAQQAVDQAQHTLEEAQSSLTTANAEAAQALANLNGNPNAPIDQQPSVMAAQARLDRAKLNQGYTEILAPSAGTVTRVDQLQVGGYVNPAQTVFWLLSGQPWVEANFKEDQLAKMKIGQKAEIKIDACGQKFAGHVASFSPGTGSTFSALPAQNATGNWVKVTQRLPVQIAFDSAPPENCGRAGLSTQAKVDLTSTPAAAPQQANK